MSQTVAADVVLRPRLGPYPSARRQRVTLGSTQRVYFDVVNTQTGALVPGAEGLAGGYWIDVVEGDDAPAQPAEVVEITPGTLAVDINSEIPGTHTVRVSIEAPSQEAAEIVFDVSTAGAATLISGTTIPWGPIQAVSAAWSASATRAEARVVVPPLAREEGAAAGAAAAVVAIEGDVQAVETARAQVESNAGAVAEARTDVTAKAGQVEQARSQVAGNTTTVTQAQADVTAKAGQASAAATTATNAATTAAAIVANRRKLTTTLSALRGYPLSDVVAGDLMDTIGRLSVADQVAGTFRWTAGSVKPDDNAMVIRPDSVPSGSAGRWERVIVGGIVRPEWWGVVPDDSTKGVVNADAFNAMLTWAASYGAKCCCDLSGRGYYFGGEIDGSLVASAGFEVRGSAPWSDIYLSAYGAAKCWWRGSETVENKDIVFRNIRFNSAEGPQMPDHPIPIYLPNATECRRENVRFLGVGNTCIWESSSFNNDDFGIVQSMACGYQPVEKSVSSTARITTTAGSQTITSNEPVFAQDDVGRDFYLGGGGPQAPLTQGIYVKIASYVSPTQVTVDTAPVISGTYPMSFGAPRGTMTAGSAVLTLSAPMLRIPQDVGRWIYVDGADHNDGVLVARIQSIESATACTLDFAAVKSVANALVALTPIFFFGKTSANRVSNRAGPNDVDISGGYIENYSGLAIILKYATSFKLRNFKLHSLACSSLNNFARSQRQLTIDESPNVAYQGDMGYGYDPQAGMIAVTGSRSGLNLQEGVLGRGISNHPVMDISRCGSFSRINIGALYFSKDFSLDDKIIRMPSNQALHRILRVSEMARCYREVDEVMLPGVSVSPTSYSQMRTVPNNGFIDFVPPMLAGTVKIVFADGAMEVYFKRNGVLRAERLWGTANAAYSTSELTGSSGATNTVTANVMPGAIRVENRIGGSRDIYLTFNGAV